MTSPRHDPESHTAQAAAKTRQTLDAILTEVTNEEMSAVELFFEIKHYARKLRKLNGPVVETISDDTATPGQLRRALALIKYRIQGLKYLTAQLN